VQLELLFGLLAQTGHCRGVPLIRGGGGTCLGRYQGFGHATAPGLTVGFLRTCAVGATNESYTRALAIWGRGSIRQAESALGLWHAEDNESVLDCCTTRGLCNGILPEWEYTSADGVFYGFVRKCEGIKQSDMAFRWAKLPVISEKPIGGDILVFIGRNATTRATT
jgi:hypothetical protein